MAVRTAEAEWIGNLREGNGTVKTGSGLVEVGYSFVSRFESGDDSNPEELIGAAHAGCFSMALSAGLEKAGYKPERVHTVARVHLDKDDGGFSITRIELETLGEVTGIDDEAFQEQAEAAKDNCPVSRALTGVEISLSARLG